MELIGGHCSTCGEFIGYATREYCPNCATDFDNDEQLDDEQLDDEELDDEELDDGSHSNPSTPPISLRTLAAIAMYGTANISVGLADLLVTQLAAEQQATGSSQEAILAGWSAARPAETRKPLPPRAARATVKAIATSHEDTNGMSIASLALSLINVIPCFWIVPIPAFMGVIFGFVGRSQMKRSGLVNGKGMATAGITLGIVALVMWAGITVPLFVRGTLFCDHRVKLC
jgi:hypothetical protein